MLKSKFPEERYLQLNNLIDNYLDQEDESSKQAVIDALKRFNFRTEHGLFKQCIYRLLILLGVHSQTLNHWGFFKSPILELKCSLDDKKLDAKL